MMNVSEMDDIRTHDVSLEAVIAPDDEPLSHDDCEQCGAPVDRLQRYCVSCGAHRHHVPDPAARYLAQASARARVGASARRPAARRRSSVSPLTAVLVAAVLAGGGVAVGAAIDGGSTNNNAQVIRALHRLEAGQSAVGAGLGSHRAAGADSHSGKTKQSASAVKRLQHATGSSYVRQAQQLSNSVSIP